jgi:sulfoxide reductase heme-binding subunit YedZ
VNLQTWPLPARLIATLAMLVLAASVLPTLVAPIAASDLPLIWWASRASGIVAYLALALSMVFGLAVTGRVGGLARATFFELHQQWTLAAVIAVVVHVVTIVGHATSRVPVVAAVVPLASPTLTGAVAIGTIALWGMALMVATSWLRTHIPYRAWRIVHAAAFGTFLLALAHAITAGTDTGMAWMVVLYAATGGVVVGAAVYRFARRLN